MTRGRGGSGGTSGVTIETEAFAQRRQRVGRDERHDDDRSHRERVRRKRQRHGVARARADSGKRTCDISEQIARHGQSSSRVSPPVEARSRAIEGRRSGPNLSSVVRLDTGPQVLLLPVANGYFATIIAAMLIRLRAVLLGHVALGFDRLGHEIEQLGVVVGGVVAFDEIEPRRSSGWPSGSPRLAQRIVQAAGLSRGACRRRSARSRAPRPRPSPCGSRRGARQPGERSRPRRRRATGGQLHAASTCRKARARSSVRAWPARRPTTHESPARRRAA